MLGKRSAIIGLSQQEAPEPLLYDRYVTVDLPHVVRLEPLEAAKAQVNGK